MSHSLWLHGLHTRLPCPSPSPRVCSNSYPLSRWRHPTISSFIDPVSSCFPSIRVSSYDSALRIRLPKYWSFSINTWDEYSGLISFRMDWFDLPAVQGTLKSLLQHHSLKASAFWHSAFFMVHLTHPCMTTGKTIALTMKRLNSLDLFKFS